MMFSYKDEVAGMNYTGMIERLDEAFLSAIPSLFKPLLV
jgi:hypothetical protein